MTTPLNGDTKVILNELTHIKEDLREVKADTKYIINNFIRRTTVWKLAGVGGVLLSGLATVVFYLAKLHIGG